MWRYQSISYLMAVSFLLGLAGCASDSPKPAAETPAPSAVAQAEQGQDQPPAGEVQERAVPRTMPGAIMTPGAPRILQQPAAPAVPPSLPCAGGGGILPGQYAIGTWRGTYLTAVNGGGRNTEPVVRTDAQVAGQAEKYKLFVLPSNDPHGQYFIQTATTNCMTAVGGGGRIDNVLNTDRTVAQAWEFFRFYFDQGTGYHAIQTVSTNYLTALGGGGHADSPAVHTDAVKVDNWERFHLWKCGDLGSNFRYSIWVPYNGTLLMAMGGGGRIKDALHAYEAPSGGWGMFMLIKQPDGSYAIQTASGNYITADGGGGLAAGSANSDVLHTDATQVQAWERFWFIDQGDCTYRIQTVKGWYLGFPPSHIVDGKIASFTTRISDPNAALKFKLIAAFL